jgi:hypothetical protein
MLEAVNPPLHKDRAEHVLLPSPAQNLLLVPKLGVLAALQNSGKWSCQPYLAKSQLSPYVPARCSSPRNDMKEYQKI